MNYINFTITCKNVLPDDGPKGTKHVSTAINRADITPLHLYFNGIYLHHTDRRTCCVTSQSLIREVFRIKNML
jgi:hypothetical protein